MKPNPNENKQDFLKRCTLSRVSGGSSSTDAFGACNLDWERMTAASLSADEKQVSLSAPLDMADASPEASAGQRKFLIAAYTGQPVKTFWGDDLYISVDGISTNKKIPILREHERDRPVGFGQAFMANGQFMIDGVFSEYAADAENVIKLADEGYPWEASVGVFAKAIRRLEPDEKMIVNGAEIAGPATVWTQSKVREVSFVALGADENTAAIVMGENAGAASVEIVTDHQEEKMEITKDSLEKDAPELLAGIRGQAMQAERERIIEIIEADGDPKITMAAIIDGTDVNAVFKSFFHAEKQKKIDGLAQMAAEAPESMGAEVPPEPEPNVAADVALADKAMQIAKIQGVDIAEATRMALADDEKLAAKWAANLIN